MTGLTDGLRNPCSKTEHTRCVKRRNRIRDKNREYVIVSDAGLIAESSENMSVSLEDLVPRGAPVLWVASTGGHLEQLVRLSSRVEESSASAWVTFDTQQSSSLLAGRNRFTVGYVRPRDLYGAIAAAVKVYPLLRTRRFQFCISTGSALATFILPLAGFLGLRAIYIESVSRTAGPSLTGKLLAAIPRVDTFTQHRNWSSERWPHISSVLDSWVAKERDIEKKPLKIFVTLGTIKPYRFDRAVNAIIEILRDDDEVVWQLGETTRDDVPGTAFRELTTEQMAHHINTADVVVTHAGVGSILNILDEGRLPVIVVREKDYNEHVDNHQRQIAETMSRNQLARKLSLDCPDRDTLLLANSWKVERGSRSEY